MDDVNATFFVSSETQKRLNSSLLHNERRMSGEENLGIGYGSQSFQYDLECIRVDAILRLFHHIHAWRARKKCRCG